MAIFRTFATGQTGVFNIPADASGVSATVNGSNASISFAAGVVTISPTPAAGDAVEITYTPTLAQPPGGGGGAAPAYNSIIVPPPAYLTPNDKAPLIGSASHYPRFSRQGVRPFAHFDLAANITMTGSGSPQKNDVARPDAPYGSTAVHITVPASQTTKVAQTVIPFPSGLDVRNGYFRLRIQKVSGTDGINAVGLELFAAGTPAAPGSDFISTRTELVNPFINNAVIAGAGFHCGDGVTPTNGMVMNGAATIAALQSIKWVRVSLVGTSGSWVAALGSLEWVPNGRNKAAVVFTFDDAKPDTWTHAAPIMHKYGFPGVLYPSPAMTLSPSGSSTTLNIDQIKALQEQHGWQVACQAGSTENSGITDAFTDDEMIAEMEMVKTIFAGAGLTGTLDGSYYSGMTKSSVGPTGTPRMRILQKFFRTARAYYEAQGNAGTDGTIVPLRNGEFWPFVDPMQIKSLNFTRFSDATDQARNLLNAQEHCQQADLSKGVAIFTAHNITSYVGSFDQLCSWLDQNRSTYDVMTLDDLYNS